MEAGLSSPQHSLAEDMYRDVSSWDASYLLTLFIPSNWPAAPLSFGTGGNSHRSGLVWVFHCLPSAQQTNQRIKRSCVDKIYSRLKLRINSQCPAFSQSPFNPDAMGKCWVLLREPNSSLAKIYRCNKPDKAVAWDSEPVWENNSQTS